VYHDEFWHHRRVVEPLQRTILNTLPMEGFVRRPFVQVPLDFRKDGTSGTTFWYPPDLHMTSDLKTTVVDLICSKLGIGEPSATWTTTGTQPHVVIKPRQQPPSSAAWLDYLEQIETAKETQPVIGVTTGGKLISSDLEDDSPHILISGGSGSGKSALTRLIASQALHHGNKVVVLDFKRSSHRWALGLPGVTYCRDIIEIHDALVTVADIAEDRNRLADDPNADLGPRIWLVCEEMNATTDKLRDYWELTRDKTDPKRSPAIQALKDILFMGRSAKVNAVVIAQRLEANVVGGGAARENFADRYLARYTPQTWKMLAGDVWPMPKKTKQSGRWQSVKHSEAHATQVIFVTEAQAIEWALNGRDVPAITERNDQRKHLGHVPAGTRVGLRDALPQLPGPTLTLVALRKHAQRDDRFPAGEYDGTQNVYDLDELVAWKTRRDAAALVAVGGVR
jgi:hypothetical protein